MDTTALTVWHSLLQTAPEQSALLSRDLAAELQQLPKLSIDPHHPQMNFDDELSRIHFTWFSPFLRSLPENEIKLFTSALSPEQIKGLKQILLFSNSLPAPSPLGKEYLRNTLWETLTPSEDLIPPSSLPQNPLNTLLELSPKEFSSLIDLLSMHDLSIEIRQIIETSKLKSIYSLLSKPQNAFLKTLLHKKEPVSFKKMGLLNWKGDRHSLKSLLFQRGINRIAKALYGHHPSLIWYVAHRLDSEEGQQLMTLCIPLDHPKAAQILSDQVVELIHALKSNNPS